MFVPQAVALSTMTRLVSWHLTFKTHSGKPAARVKKGFGPHHRRPKHRRPKYQCCLLLPPNVPSAIVRKFNPGWPTTTSVPLLVRTCSLIIHRSQLRPLLKGWRIAFPPSQLILCGWRINGRLERAGRAGSCMLIRIDEICEIVR